MSSCWLVLVLAAAQGGCGRATTEAGYKQYRKDYLYYPNVNGFLKTHVIPAAWQDAHLRCFFEGSVLASPLNKKLERAILTEIKKIDQSVFIGVSATFSKGDFFSVEGVPLDNIPHSWSPWQRNKAKDEQCIVMNKEGRIATASCNDSQPYICYKKASEIKRDILLEACGTTDPDYVFDSRTSHCYKFHRFGQPWPRAFMACSAEGGSLVVINSEVEATVLKELLYKHPKTEVRATDMESISIGYREQNGMTLTIDGRRLQEAGYEKWAEDQPDNLGSEEHCGAMFRDGTLNDIRCDVSTPFICEMVPGRLQRNTEFFIAPKVQFEIVPKRA